MAITGTKSAPPRKPFNFDEMKKLGEEGTRRVADYLNKNGRYIVADVQENPLYRAMGVDLLLSEKGSARQVKIEVKTDTHADHFFFETVSSANRPGWAYDTAADWVVYYFAALGLAYVLPWKKTLAWFLENKHMFSVVGTSSENTFAYWRSQGHLVPREAVQKALNVRVLELGKVNVGR